MIKLNIISGFIQDNRFHMLTINGQKVYGAYSSDKLRSFARLLDDDTQTTITDKNTEIVLPVEINRELAKDLFFIADKLDNPL